MDWWRKADGEGLVHKIASEDTTLFYFWKSYGSVTALRITEKVDDDIAWEVSLLGRIGMTTVFNAAYVINSYTKGGFPQAGKANILMKILCYPELIEQMEEQISGLPIRMRLDEQERMRSIYVPSSDPWNEGRELHNRTVDSFLSAKGAYLARMVTGENYALGRAIPETFRKPVVEEKGESTGEIPVVEAILQSELVFYNRNSGNTPDEPIFYLT
ncbi:MAG: hypothetical protein AABX51_05545 [Nanoarchaeota archaeon]